MSKYTFKFVGGSEAVNPEMGLLQPGAEYRFGYSSKEESTIKEGEHPVEKRFDEGYAIRLAASSQWEAVSKSAKDLVVLLDVDHMLCMSDKDTSKEHMARFHPPTNTPKGE